MANVRACALPDACAACVNSSALTFQSVTRSARAAMVRKTVAMTNAANLQRRFMGPLQAARLLPRAGTDAQRRRLRDDRDTSEIVIRPNGSMSEHDRAPLYHL